MTLRYRTRQFQQKKYKITKIFMLFLIDASGSTLYQSRRRRNETKAHWREKNGWLVLIAGGYNSRRRSPMFENE